MFYSYFRQRVLLKPVEIKKDEINLQCYVPSYRLLSSMNYFIFRQCNNQQIHFERQPKLFIDNYANRLGYLRTATIVSKLIFRSEKEFRVLSSIARIDIRAQLFPKEVFIDR